MNSSVLSYDKHSVLKITGDGTIYSNILDSYDMQRSTIYIDVENKRGCAFVGVRLSDEDRSAKTVIHTPNVVA